MNAIVKFSLLTILLFSSWLMLAQNQQLVDSLYRQVSELKSDSAKVDLLNQISAHYLFTNTTGARQPGTKALEISRKTNNKKGEMGALIRLGVMHYRLSHFDSSLTYYNNGFNVAKENNDSLYMIKFRKNIALSQTTLGKYQEALATYYATLAFFEKYDSLNAAKTYLDIASVYYHLNDFEQAYSKAKQGYQLAQQCQSQQTCANALNSMGVFLKRMNKPEQAIKAYKQSYQIQIQLGEKLGQSMALINIGNIYYENKQYQECLPYWDTVLILTKQIEAKQSEAEAYLSLGNTYYKLKQYKKANFNTLKAYNIANNIKANKLTLDAAISLADSYSVLNQLANANKYYRISHTIKDSLFNEQMAKNVTEMRIKYETLEKEKKNIKLAKENEIQVLKIKMERNKKRISFVILIAFILGFILLFIRNKQKQQQKLLEEKGLRIKSIIHAQDQERARIARDLHDGIGQILSATSMKFSLFINKTLKQTNINVNEIDESLKMLNNACDELRTISHQMMPRSLKDGGLVVAINDLLEKTLKKSEINYTFDSFGLSLDLTNNVEIGIYRITQELINNAIKHAACSQVSVQLYKNKSQLILMVEDNGCGIVSDKNSKGMGMRNIKSRTETLNGVFNIEKAPQSGTIATIKVPIE